MLKRVPLEAITWIAGLVMLACLDSGNNHFTLCPLKNAGFEPSKAGFRAQSENGQRSFVNGPVINRQPDLIDQGTGYFL